MYIQKDEVQQSSSFRSGFEPDTLAVILREMQNDTFGTTPEEKVRNLGENLYEDIVETATHIRDSIHYYGGYNDHQDDVVYEDKTSTKAQPTEPIEKYIPHKGYESPEGAALIYLTATKQATQTLGVENQLDPDIYQAAVQSFNEAEARRNPDYARNANLNLGQSLDATPAKFAYYESVRTREFDDIMAANVHKEPSLGGAIVEDIIRSAPNERDALTHLEQFSDKLYKLEKGEDAKLTNLGRSRNAKEWLPSGMDGLDISGLIEMADKDIIEHKKKLPYLLSSANDKNSRQHSGFEQVTKDDVGIDF